jgi:hypothetical protein
MRSAVTAAPWNTRKVIAWQRWRHLAMTASIQFARNLSDPDTHHHRGGLGISGTPRYCMAGVGAPRTRETMGARQTLVEGTCRTRSPAVRRRLRTPRRVPIPHAWIMHPGLLFRDHSCSAGYTLSTVLDSPGILEVAGVSATLQVKPGLSNQARPAPQCCTRF